MEKLLPAMGETLIPSPVRGKSKMRPLLMILACGLLSLGGYQNAYSQRPGTNAREDRPSQRWLPLPEGGQGNISDQVRLLELLRSQIATSSDQPPMPDLTEAQLRELDKAYQAWTEQSGGAQLPDWNNIPKDWVDKAVANPEQLKQAQRLIEQYARQRKLPLPNSLPRQSPSAMRQSSTLPRSTQPRSTPDDASSQTKLPPSPIVRSSKPKATESHATDFKHTESQNTESQNTESQNTESQNTESQNVQSQSRDGRGRSAQGIEAQGSQTQSKSVPSSNARDGSNAQASPASADSLAGASVAGARSAPGARAASDPAQAPTAENTTAENTTGESPAPLASDATGKQVLNRPNGLSDVARLNALRDLLEIVKTVQAVPHSPRDGKAGSSNRLADDARNNIWTRKPQPNRAANSERNGADASNRNAPNEATAAGARVPRGANAQPLSATDRRSRTNGEVLNRANHQDSETAKGDEHPRDQELASDDSFDVPSPQANASLENGTFDVPPMLQSATSASDSSNRADRRAPRISSLQSSGLRTAARSSATQRSTSQDSTAERSGGFRGSEAPSASSVLRSIGIPKIASEVSTGLSPSQAEIQAKIQHDIQQFGWHTTVRRIIAETFQEEAGAQPQAKVPSESSVKSQSPEARRSTPRQLSVNLTAARQSMRDALTSSRLTSVLADVWKAIATAPPTEDSASSAPAPLSRQWHKWKWNGKFEQSGNELPIVLLIVAAVCLAVWVSRKRPAFFRAGRALDTRWAKEALAEGIRTRADVIRAFHRFVSQTAEPVASWWTHRYVARRLVESTPQLAAAMSDLSSVYEQARYMPPEAELSAEQISRVYGALRECAAYGSSAANVST